MPSARPAPDGAPAAVEAGALSCDLPDFTASTSDFTTRPCGPLPATAAISMFASFARRLASGEAKTRAEPLAPVGAGLAGGGPAAGPVASEVDGMAALPVVTGAAGAGAGFGA